MVAFAIESKKKNLHWVAFVLPLILYIFREDRTPEYSLFVGDLSSDVDETFLLVAKDNNTHNYNTNTNLFFFIY